MNTATNFISFLLGISSCVTNCLPSALPVNVSQDVKKEVAIVYKLGDVIPEKVIDGLIAQYATGTKAYQMKRTIECESFGFQNIQSKIITKKGVKEDSWGIAQINLYWNPQVSKEQALDPQFAVKFMSDNWRKTKWYAYLPETDSCNFVYE